jgi:acetyltransferase EpsM
MKPNDLVILGAGGHAKVVIDVVLSQGLYDVRAIVDRPSVATQDLLGFPVHTGIENLSPGFFVVAIGDNEIRKRCFEQMVLAGWRPATIVHSSAVVSRFCTMDDGTVVCANAVVNAGARVGQNCIINTSAVVEHDCEVGAHSHIAVGARLAGHTSVGTGVLFGIAATSIPEISVGDWATVGAGAAVVADVSDHSTVVGVPARAVRPKSLCD